ncbi:MAG: sensor domain-containing diguanylate cyclase [Defluviitaleaceae bacterium]|nr:sensor domain-containing diguanylate cyclase [Defluviitaleaceae bacterium]
MDKERLYSEIIDIIDSGVYFVDTEKRIIFWNKAAEKISGYSKDEVLGVACENTNLNHIDENGTQLCKVGCPLYATIIDGCKRTANVFLRNKDGARVPIKVNIFPIERDGQIIGAVEIFSQSSPLIYDNALIEGLKNNASTDALTGLPNRKSLESFIEFKLGETKRFDRIFGIIFLDIDNFGSFNKEFGHELGDLVLKNVAESVVKTVRNTDMFGRWGGEEFIGVFEVKQDFETSIVAEKLRMLIENSIIDSNNGVKLSVTASLGCTIIRATDTIFTAISRADEMMRASKKKGKNRISYTG